MPIEKKPIVFIGCSTEALPVAHTIANALADRAIVQLWNQGVFPPGSYVLETLIEKGAGYDFAILLFANDDVVEIHGQQMLAARDNTVLEAGFFIGRVGRERTFIMVPDLPNLRLPSDFDGLIHVRYTADSPPQLQQAMIGQACFQIRERIGELSRRRPIFENNLTDGMVFLLRVLDNNPASDRDRLGTQLAGYNRVDHIVDADGWKRAAEYIMVFLQYLKLVDMRAVTIIEYTLSKDGKSLISDPRTAAKFRKAFEADIRPPRMHL